MNRVRNALGLGAGATLLLAADAAYAGEDVINSGDTAWILTSSALVLLMTLPGLALFYGGLVRSKNILSVLMQCLTSAGVIGVLWVVVGYSLAFGAGGPTGIVAVGRSGQTLWEVPNKHVLYELRSHPLLPGWLLHVGGK